MATSIVQPAGSAPLVNREIPRRMAKADLAKRESPNFLLAIGACLDYARRAVGWTVDQLAAELGDKDRKQVARWIRGEERTQVDAVFAVPALRAPFVIALAQLANCDVETTIRIRKTA